MTQKTKGMRAHKQASSTRSKSKQDDSFFRPFAGLPAAPPPPEPSRPGAQAPARPPSTSKRAKGQEDPDDSLTFERFMSGVTPLQDSGSRRVTTSKSAQGISASPLNEAKIAQLQAEELQARERLARLVQEGSRFEIIDDGRRVEGRRRGVDGALVRRMRLGELPMDATLDLHGMHLQQARDQVESFVRDCRVRGDRVVLIVHGRGLNSPGQHSVLRGEVTAWLSEGKCAVHVSAFVTAAPELGGEGAVCVLLASQKQSPRRI